MSRDPDAYLLDRGARRKAGPSASPAGAETWRTEWEGRVRTAWAGGKIEHRPDRRAPFGTLAWSGYLLPLTGDVLAGYREYQRANGIRVDDPLGDEERWAFERQYIEAHRENHTNK